VLERKGGEREEGEYVLKNSGMASLWVGGGK
jgi:hypothetical protein